jgi:hypothetical protein
MSANSGANPMDIDNILAIFSPPTSRRELPIWVVGQVVWYGGYNNPVS